MPTWPHQDAPEPDHGPSISLWELLNKKQPTDGADYTPLTRVLEAAHAQASAGKGVERHGNGRDFTAQPIMEIGRMVGPGFALGQAMKKAQEAAGMLQRGERDAAMRELLGVIVYAAAAYLLIEESPS